eukprot:c19357_g1_i3.p1 GENE.c19357_g1_i3~~c19357_g1_i3.p1  ORF type:complete len:1108 (+),score=243.17 c19357_g1_i3:480-3326(+)
MVCEGMVNVAVNFACVHLHSQVDVVVLKYDMDTTNHQVLKLFVQFIQDYPRASAILHGAVIDLFHHPKLPPVPVNKKFYSLVTGGARGIGEFISLELAKQGRNIIVTGRPGHNAGEAFAQQLQETYNIDDLVRSMTDRKIVLDVVVHNAAVGTKTASFQTTETHDLPDVLVSVNSVGPVLLQDALLNQAGLLRSGAEGGCTVLVISSVGALRVFSEMHPIDLASKVMVNTWAQHLEQKNPGLNVVILSPGATDTDMLQQSVLNRLRDSGKLKTFIEQLPKRMLIRPDDLGAIAAFLCDPQVCGVANGTNVAACCGMQLDFNSMPKIEDGADTWPSPVQAHFQCELNLFHASKNPSGNVNFGTAVNGALPLTLLAHLPRFLTPNDVKYQVPAGSTAFREFVVNVCQCCHNSEQTITANTVYSALSLSAYHLKRVLVSGVPKKLIGFLESHSGAEFAEARLGAGDQSDQFSGHWVFVEGSVDGAQGVSLSVAVSHAQHLTESTSAHPSVTIFVLASHAQLTEFKSLPLSSAVGFAFTFGWTRNLSCGVLQTSSPDLLAALQEGAYFFPVPSPLQASALTRNEISNGSYEALLDCVLEMLAQSEGVDVRKEQVMFGVGASSILEMFGRVLFCPGSLVGIDAPFYFGFHEDMGRSGVSLLPTYFDDGDEYCDRTGARRVLGKQSRPRIPNTLRVRCQRAYEDGAAGFIVCNPHNPTGRVYPATEIEELCEWVLSLNSKPLTSESRDGQFHVIFDELYAHSVFSEDATFVSALSYVQQSPCIHVVRGFAKDFGLCGFKMGLGFSSNAQLLSKAREWAQIIRPSLAMAGLITDLLKKTEHGTVVFAQNKVILARRSALAMEEFTRQQISFVVPKSGVFFMIDLSSELAVQPKESENTVFIQLLKKKGVNIVPGSLLGSKPGWFRLCHVTGDEEGMIEGIRRLGSFVKATLRQGK